MTSVLAFDVGGTWLRGALVVDGAIVERRAVSTPVGDGEAFTSALVVCGRELGGAPRAAGVALAGLLDVGAGRVVRADSLGLSDLDLAGPVGAALGLPAVLVNDVNAAALGEADAAGVSDLAAVFVGTGVGTGFVAGGHLVEGARGMAGEGGHLVLRPGGRPCTFGCRGCVEAYLGGHALGRRAAELGVGEDAAALLAAVADGHAGAAEAWDEARDALSWLVATLVALFDPRHLVVGGGVARRAPGLLDVAREAATTGLGSREVEVTAARLDDDAGVLGAARRAVALATSRGAG